jgi:glutathionylspermidine synthase
MNVPYKLGEPLPSDIWHKVKLQTVFDCCKWDIQSEDHCVLADFPLLIGEGTWRELSVELSAAEAELTTRPDLHRSLGLTADIQQAFLGHDSTPGVARVMRFDFHFTENGWRISEVNADVPGGFIEASGFTQLMAARYAGTLAPPDPASLYAQSVVTRVGTSSTVGLVHATAYSDDRQVMQFLGRRLAHKGVRLIMASPEHIAWEKECAVVSSSFARERLDALVRFYPAEWLPNLRPRARWFHYFTNSRTPMSNPASALLVQSKRFPMVWSELSTNLPTWKAMLPETKCPSLVSNDLRNWVVKAAFGRVGEHIGISGVTPERDLCSIHRAARRHPLQWVAQRRFWVVPVSDGTQDYYPSIGVFTIDGSTAGAYARIGRKPLIDDEAQDVAVLITDRGRKA